LFFSPSLLALLISGRSGQQAGRSDNYPDRAETRLFFLWLYGLLSYLPPSMETPALLIGPVVAIAFLVLLPFLSGEGEKSWRRRPIAVLTVLLIAIILGTLTHLAGYTPWSPHMNAWSADPVPDSFYTQDCSRATRRARISGQAMRNCHSLGELGGQRGRPSIASRCD